MKLAVFLHCAVMGDYWQDVDNEITKKLEKSDLLKHAEFYKHNIVKKVTNYEFPTLELIKKFAEDNTNYAILYLHTKGVSYQNDRITVASWRRCMLHFLVERWESCIYQIALHKYDALGCQFIKTPLPHFQGNFFWTTSKHVKNLCMPREVDLSKVNNNWTERHKAEAWVCSSEGKFKSVYDWNCNPYVDIIEESKYKKIFF